MTSNLKVARTWALGRGDEAHSSNGNLSCCGNVLTSYSTPIAHLVPGKRGHMVALLTTEGYSVTTEGKHKNAARKATGYGVELALFTVPFLLLSTGHHWGRSTAGRVAQGYSIEDQHKANLDDYDQRIAAERVRIKAARVYKDQDRLNRLIAERGEYVRTFGVEV